MVMVLTTMSAWDFPQLGLDQNALIFTANFFDSTGSFVDARMFTVAKSALYNGPTGQTSDSPPVHRPGEAPWRRPWCWMPIPILIWWRLISRITKVTLYTLTNSAANPPTLSRRRHHPGAGLYGRRPMRRNPDRATHLIDTSDARFVNASTQIGNSLFQVHSISSSPTTLVGAKCRFYEFDTVNKQVIQHGDFSRSSTSFDFNASIAANRNKDVFVTWSATDPTNNINAEVRFSGRRHTDPPDVIPSPGSLLFASNTSLTG